MKENKNTVCDPCERDFEHKIHELVREGKAPSHDARAKREHEIKSVFGEDHSAHAPMHDMNHKEPAHAAVGHSAPKPHGAMGSHPAAKPHTAASKVKK